ncbi:MAG: tetratricopeptide repeat protein [Proteobacteria bacterium]|nr:tetratricopeptide repeat protein [Pseudomonadota bacterium]
MNCKGLELNHSPKNLSRRNFLSTGLRTAGGILLLGPTALQGCGSHVTPTPRIPTIPRPYRSKYNTIAHEILDIELEHKNRTRDYLILDTIIDLAKKRIQSLEAIDESSRHNALLALKTIGDLLITCGFEYERIRLLCFGLGSKRINCDSYSALYLAIGETLEFPIQMVRAPAHTFIRWQLNTKEYINWETTIGSEKDDRYYITRHNIARKSNGITSLKSLDVNRNREEILANAFVNSGVEWLRKCRSDKAIDRFNEAIRRDPKYETPYYNMGLVYYNMGRMKEAIKWCNQAIKLNPNHLKSHAILESAYGEIGERLKSRAHLKRVTQLDAGFYRKEAIESRKKKKIICKRDTYS